MQVAILAGGLATRLRELTKERPKSLVRVLEKPFLEHQLELLKKSAVKDIVLCLGHLGEQIERYFGDGGQYGVSIKYSFEDKPLGTAGAIKNAEPLLDEVFFTLYGDSFLFMDFSAVMSFFETRNKLALMTVYKNHDRYDRSNTTISGELVKQFSKGEKTKDMVYIEYGANIFRKRVLEMIPRGEFYSLDDLFLNLIEKQELLAYEVKERFYEIGSPQGLEDFKQFLTRSLLSYKGEKNSYLG